MSGTLSESSISQRSKDLGLNAAGARAVQPSSSYRSAPSGSSLKAMLLRSTSVRSLVIASITSHIASGKGDS